MKQLLVITPTYNESQNISLIIDEIFKACSTIKGWSTDILVVDDTSPDGTADIVKKIQRRSRTSRVHLLMGKKAGLGKAYLRGFKYGLKKPYNAFVMMDADFSHDPKAIPTMLATMETGNDYVIGSRYVEGGAIPGNWPLLRILNSRVANSLAKLLTGIDKSVADITGGFKVINRAALQEIDLSTIHAAGYFFQVNLVHAFLQKRFRVAEAPIIFADRKYGSSKLKFKDILELMYRAYMLNPQSSVRQLVRFATVGLIGTIINVSALTLLVRVFHVDVLVAAALAIEISIISNFFLNHYYTFGHRQDSRSPSSIVFKMGKFNVGALSGAAISFLLFTLLFKFVGWAYVPADLLAIVAAMGWNYWVSTKYIWKMVDAVS